MHREKIQLKYVNRRLHAIKTLVWKELLSIWRDRSYIFQAAILPLLTYTVLYHSSKIDDGSPRFEGTIGLPYAAVALLFLTMYEVALQGLLLGGERLVAERQQGTVYTLLASPTNRADIALAPAVAALAFVMPNFLLLLGAIGVVGWGWEFVTVPFLILALAIAFHTASIGVWFGTRARSQGQVRNTALQFWVLTMGLAFGGGSMPAAMDSALRVIPLYWGVRALTDVMTVGSGAGWSFALVYLFVGSGALLHCAGRGLLPKTVVKTDGVGAAVPERSDATTGRGHVE